MKAGDVYSYLASTFSDALRLGSNFILDQAKLERLEESAGHSSAVLARLNQMDREMKDGQEATAARIERLEHAVKDAITYRTEADLSLIHI